MTKQLMIYENVIPVSSEKHTDIYVQTGKDWRFAADLNTAPILVAEMEPASAEMPIVFAGEGETLTVVALLGLRAGENLFVTPEGAWRSTYIPAFFRRYPFVFAETGKDGQTLTLCIDESYEGVNSDGRGERLFDSTGERTQYLKTMLQFTSDYQAQHNLTRAFCQRVAELGLLEPAIANATLSDGQTLTVTGFQRVNRDKLRALDDAEVTALFRNDMLGMIYAHLASLGHLAGLANRTETTKTPEPALAEE